MLPDRTWPFPVRPGSFETVDNFVRRLRAANFVSDVAWGYWVKPTTRATGLEASDALPLIAEAVGGLTAGHFERNDSAFPRHTDGRACGNCTTGLEDRFGCVRCATGARVEQAPHDGPRVCRRHMVWVGPGTIPEEQYPVGAEVLRADRAYRRLRKRSLLDAHRLAEILDCVEVWEDAPRDPGARFILAIRLARQVFSPRSIDTFAARTVDAGPRYAALTSTVTAIAQTDDCATLIDAVWLLLRAAGHQDQTAPHTFICTQKEKNIDERDELDQLRTSHYPKWRHLHRSQCTSADRPGTRFGRERHMSGENTYVCARGHTFPQAPNLFKLVKKSTGCRVCSNKVVLAGFNSVADVAPHLVPSWHATKNGGLRPEDVVAGSEDIVYWTCPEGHDYDMSVTRRNKGTGCPYCASSRVDPAINALSMTHRALSREWHPHLNGERTPDTVTHGSSKIAWWLCPKGHDFQMRIERRTRRGQGCVYCSHQKVHPTTSLAVTRADIAARWHPRKNGSLTPADVLANSRKTVWWVCPKRHTYRSPVYIQNRGTGCNVCSGRVVDAQNSMRTTRPDLSAQFHPHKNGMLTPDNLLATTPRVLWWVCKEGHEWQASGKNRARDNTGCGYCGNTKVWVGWNDLDTTRPDLALDFDEANNTFTPQDVVAGTNKVVAWKCHTCGHRWTARAADRARGQGCPACRKSSAPPAT
ncbi:zinc-ribbon domain-containing protein [Microbacterium sp.]|uniref:zinc-ribbon domain-containing protein n=1 Tax=Microbacterium sp. TaxID=51671 RepID=UPI003A93A477